jgi:hypothetical protein
MTAFFCFLIGAAFAGMPDHRTDKVHCISKQIPAYKKSLYRKTVEKILPEYPLHPIDLFCYL